MKEIFNLAIKLRNKSRTSILNIILISIALIILISLNTYADSAINYMKKDVYNSIFFKSLEVNPSNEVPIDRIKKDLQSISHIDIVTDFYAYSNLLNSTELKNDKLEGTVEFYVANNHSLKRIKYGTNFPDEEGNYLICPEKLYSTSNTDSLKFISSKYAFDMKDYLNKDISFTYKSNLGENSYQETYKVIGLYETQNYLDANICFTKEESLKRIAENMYSDDIDVQTGESNLKYQTGIFVQVDSLQNIDTVQKSINKMGYIATKNASVVESYFYNIEKSSQMISFIIILVTICIIILIICKQFNEERYNYQLLKFLGYKSKKINMVIICSNIVQMIICLMLSFLFASLFYFVFAMILCYYPFLLNNWEIIFNYGSLITIVIITIVGFFLGTLINLERLNDKL